MKLSPNLWMLLFGVLIVMLAVGSGMFGAYKACDNGGGTLIKGFECVGVNVIDVCEFGDDLLILPPITVNETFNLSHNGSG